MQHRVPPNVVYTHPHCSSIFYNESSPEGSEPPEPLGPVVLVTDTVALTLARVAAYASTGEDTPSTSEVVP